MLKSYYWEKVISIFKKLQFSNFKIFVSGFLGSSNSRRYHWFFNFLLQQKIIGAKLYVVWYYFYFGGNYDVLKSKSSCFLFNKNIKFNKSKTESKMENPAHIFREVSHTCFSSYKNCELKVRLWWVWARERKKSGFFVTFILSEGFFLTFECCRVLNKLSEYIYTFTYQKTLLHTLLLLVFKIIESL